MQICCMAPPLVSRTPRPQLRCVLVVAAMLCTAYLSVFLADGHALSPNVVLNALANTAALALVALAVRTFTNTVTWAHANTWWFLPVHMLAALIAAQLSLAVTATTLGVAAWAQGVGFTLLWLEGPARHWQLFTFVFAYAAVAGSCYGLQVIAEARHAQALRQDAELSRLRAHLDPHVLLNTLHSLLELVRSNDAAAEEAIERFGEVVRYVSAPRDAAHDLVSLHEEWEHLDDYLHLEQLRLGPRLSALLELDPNAAATRIPAMSLQPLVENAIVHGIGPRAGPGHIRVKAVRDGQEVCITVTDDGVGPSVTATPGSGSALALVQARLHAHFGPLAHIAWGAAADGLGWNVAVRVPA